MRPNDLFSDDPPLEAYSRVTDPERFRPLHARALEFLATLGREYDVRQEASFDLLPWMSSFEHARPPVALTPVLSAAAPIAVAFTTFPSLVVRFGRWHGDRFPSCGCDACRETADGEAERFEHLVQEVVAGSFREKLKLPWLRQPRLYWSLGESSARFHSRSGGGSVLSWPQVWALRRAESGTIEWQAWPRRLRGGAA